MLSLVRPRWFIPVHGERRHSSITRAWPRRSASRTSTSSICEDGDVVEIGEEVRKGDRVRAGMTFVDGLGIGDVGGEVLRDRRKLAGDGVVVVVRHRRHADGRDRRRSRRREPGVRPRGDFGRHP